jgi:hypothetical protein
MREWCKTAEYFGKTPITCRDKVRQRINNVVQNKGPLFQNLTLQRYTSKSSEYEKKHTDMIKRIPSKLLAPSTSEPSLLVPYAIETYAHCMVYHTKRWWRVANEDGWALCDDRSMIRVYFGVSGPCVQMQLRILPMWMWGYDRDHYVLQALDAWYKSLQILFGTRSSMDLSWIPLFPYSDLDSGV